MPKAVEPLLRHVWALTCISTQTWLTAYPDLSTAIRFTPKAGDHWLVLSQFATIPLWREFKAGNTAARLQQLTWLTLSKAGSHHWLVTILAGRSAGIAQAQWGKPSSYYGC